eukprot:7902177-Alexandrium_andersonii.AAC.1
MQAYHTRTHTHHTQRHARTLIAIDGRALAILAVHIACYRFVLSRRPRFASSTRSDSFMGSA